MADTVTKGVVDLLVDRMTSLSISVVKYKEILRTTD